VSNKLIHTTASRSRLSKRWTKQDDGLFRDRVEAGAVPPLISEILNRTEEEY
jgi:hypothetical protein